MTISLSQCPGQFYVPNSFTPNNDGINDIFRPILSGGNVIQYKFTIYKRCGQKIYETTDLQKGWDGKVSGTYANANIFIWLCTFQFIGKAVETKKGICALLH